MTTTNLPRQVGLTTIAAKSDSLLGRSPFLAWATDHRAGACPARSADRSNHPNYERVPWALSEPYLGDPYVNTTRTITRWCSRWRGRGWMMIERATYGKRRREKSPIGEGSCLAAEARDSLFHLARWGVCGLRPDA